MIRSPGIVDQGDRFPRRFVRQAQDHQVGGVRAAALRAAVSLRFCIGQGDQRQAGAVAQAARGFPAAVVPAAPSTKIFACCASFIPGRSFGSAKINMEITSFLAHFRPMGGAFRHPAPDAIGHAPNMP